MTTVDLWLRLAEGLAILLSAGSLGLLIRGRKSGIWLRPAAEAGTPDQGTRETLRLLVEEAQALCAELLGGVDEKWDLTGRGAEKVQRFSRFLNRVGTEPEPVSAAGTRNSYREAIALAEEGLPPSEIGKRLDLTRGEVQVLLDLQAYCLK